MKKYIFGIMMLVYFTTIGNTQSVGNDQQQNTAKEKIEAQKVAYLTRRLELTPKEAEVFWPLYNEFQAERESIQKQYKRNKRLENMTDEELEKFLRSNFEKEQELLDLKKSYFEKMKDKFSVRKIAMLQVAEKEFRTSILDKWKEKRKERRKQNRKN